MFPNNEHQQINSGKDRAPIELKETEVANQIVHFSPSKSLSFSSWVFHTLNKLTAKTGSLAPPHFKKSTAHAYIGLASMASRALSLVRRGVRGAWLLPRRSYANGENVIPLTFSSPNLVRT